MPGCCGETEGIVAWQCHAKSDPCSRASGNCSFNSVIMPGGCLRLRSYTRSDSLAVPQSTCTVYVHRSNKDIDLQASQYKVAVAATIACAPTANIKQYDVSMLRLRQQRRYWFIREETWCNALRHCIIPKQTPRCTIQSLSRFVLAIARVIQCSLF